MKATTVGARVDEQLKEQAAETFEKLGIPLSAGIEMFLENVVENGQLPFETKAQKASTEQQQKQQLRDFWRSYTVWNFQVHANFDYMSNEKKAREEYGYPCHSAGYIANSFVSGEDGITEQQAMADIAHMRSLLGGAKDLIYWALGMDKVFVPTLAGTYTDDADQWRLHFAKLMQKRGRCGIAKDGTELPLDIDELDGDDLFEYFNEWLIEAPGNNGELALLTKIAEKTDDFEEVREILRAIDLEEDFVEYVETRFEDNTNNDVV